MLPIRNRTLLVPPYQFEKAAEMTGLRHRLEKGDLWLTFAEIDKLIPPLAVTILETSEHIFDGKEIFKICRDASAAPFHITLIEPDDLEVMH